MLLPAAQFASSTTTVGVRILNAIIIIIIQVRAAKANENTCMMPSLAATTVAVLVFDPIIYVLQC